MGVFDKADEIDPGAGTERPALPAGWYPELMIEDTDMFESTNPKNKGKVYYKANLEVLVAANGAPVGTGGTFMVTVDGNKYDSHNVRDIGKVKDLLGKAWGLVEKSAINAKISKAELYATTVNKTMYRGHVVAARVSHREFEGKIFSEYEFHPVTVGSPKIFESARKGAAPAPAADAPPPVAAPAPAARVIPAGFAPHPSQEWADKGYVYELANPANVKQI